MTTVLIVPGLRDHIPEHWQTLLEERLPNARSVPPLEVNKLSCAARVGAIHQQMEKISGPVILVAHSAGVLTVAHWAVVHKRPIKGALLVAPPDLDAEWPENYPSPGSLKDHGWSPLPRYHLPFPSILAASTNDHLSSFEASWRLARDWNSKLVDLGEAGHMNPHSGFGLWPEAEELVKQLDY